jgi:putative redox protein
MDTHFVSTAHKDGMSFISSINHHRILTDAGIADGGADEGPGPKRLMLAALAGCSGIDIVGILNKMKVDFSDLQIDTEGTLSEEFPRIYNHVTIIFKIKVAAEDQAKMEKAVRLSDEKYCGVMAMFKAFAQVKTEIVYL